MNASGSLRYFLRQLAILACVVGVIGGSTDSVCAETTGSGTQRGSSERPSAAWGPPAAAAPSSAVTTTNSMEVLDDQRQLGPGDRISYRVVEERRLPIASTIGDDGTLELPLIGRVSAAGRTPRNLAYAVKRPLERDYFHRATVIVGLDVASKRSPGRVYLNGRVQTQGAVEIPADETLTLRRAIMKAGGVAEFGNSRK